ncbi:hypothetical protein ACOMHN_035870 [Nucella lapillus]
MTSRREDFESALKPYKPCAVTFKRIQRLMAIRPTNLISQMIRINMNGTQFILKRSTCIRIPHLRNLMTNYSRKKKQMDSYGFAYHLQKMSVGEEMTQITFEKNTDVFTAVIDYVQNRELHAPRIVCPKLFARELRFWGFEVDELEPCCFAQVLRFLFEQEKLDEFHGFLRKRTRQASYWLESESSSAEQKSQEPGFGLQVFYSIRRVMWPILEQPFRTVAARIYFFTTVFSIMGSFITACAETLEPFSSLNGTQATASGNSTGGNEVSPTIWNLLLFFLRLDQACITLQCIDIFFRLIFSPSPLRFFLNFINLTDGMAAIAAVIKLLIPVLFNCTTSHTLYTGCTEDALPYISTIYVLQLFRIMRILRPLSQ